MRGYDKAGPKKKLIFFYLQLKITDQRISLMNEMLLVSARRGEQNRGMGSRIEGEGGKGRAEGSERRDATTDMKKKYVVLTCFFVYY